MAHRHPFSRNVLAAGPGKAKDSSRSWKLPQELDKPVDISKVKFEVVKPWIAKRLSELLGIEDEVVIGMTMELLQGQGRIPNARGIHSNLITFLEKNTTLFLRELWNHLLEAQEREDGIPPKLLEEKRKEVEREREQEGNRSGLRTHGTEPSHISDRPAGATTGSQGIQGNGRRQEADDRSDEHRSHREKSQRDSHRHRGRSRSRDRNRERKERRSRRRRSPSGGKPGRHSRSKSRSRSKSSDDRRRSQSP